MKKGDPTYTKTRTNLKALSTGDQKREYWIQTIAKEALKALRCTHV